MSYCAYEIIDYKVKKMTEKMMMKMIIARRRVVIIVYEPDYLYHVSTVNRTPTYNMDRLVKLSNTFSASVHDVDVRRRQESNRNSTIAPPMWQNAKR